MLNEPKPFNKSTSIIEINNNNVFKVKENYKYDIDNVGDSFEEKPRKTNSEIESKKGNNLIESPDKGYLLKHLKVNNNFFQNTYESINLPEAN